MPPIVSRLAFRASYGERVSFRLILVVPIVALSLAGCAAPASTADPVEDAAASAPVTAEELGEGDLDAAVDIEVEGPVQVNHRLITIEPGASTGPHCHYGNLIGTVESGELTHYAPIYPGGVHVYRAGDAIVEGSGYVHEGKNEGDVDLVLRVTYVTPEGQPLAESDLANCDD